MIRPPMANHPMAPLAALGVAIVASGLAIWPHPAHLGESSAETAQPQETQLQYASYDARAYPAAYRSGSAPQSEALSCNPWDVSPQAMEAILQEMVRRGWQPPRSDVALASTQPNDRASMEALNPDQPLWLPSPRRGPPVETGEVVDVTIEREAGAPGANTPALDRPATVAAPATPNAPIPNSGSSEAPTPSGR
jgi:hypothetical protein